MQSGSTLYKWKQEKINKNTIFVLHEDQKIPEPEPSNKTHLYNNYKYLTYHVDIYVYEKKALDFWNLIQNY